MHEKADDDFDDVHIHLAKSASIIPVSDNLNDHTGSAANTQHHNTV